MVAGLLTAVTGLVLGGRLVRRTVYRPDRWRLPELGVAACGIAAAGGMFLTARVDPNNLYPSLSPLSWPQLAAVAAAPILIAVLPAVIAPQPPSLRGAST